MTTKEACKAALKQALLATKPALRVEGFCERAADAGAAAGTGFDPYATSTVTIHNVRFTSLRDVTQTS
jgi:hypothetical protein